jgi:hypothetical protein
MYVKNEHITVADGLKVDDGRSFPVVFAPASSIAFHVLIE